MEYLHGYANHATVRRQFPDLKRPISYPIF